MGCPIRRSQDHCSVTNSPGLIAGSSVLHRLSMPRHPPCALWPIAPTRRRDLSRPAGRPELVTTHELPEIHLGLPHSTPFRMLSADRLDEPRRFHRRSYSVLAFFVLTSPSAADSAEKSASSPTRRNVSFVSIRLSKSSVSTGINPIFVPPRSRRPQPLRFRGGRTLGIDPGESSRRPLVFDFDFTSFWFGIQSAHVKTPQPKKTPRGEASGR